MKEKKKPQKIFQKLKSKYRLVIINDTTFEEKLSLRLSRLNVFTVIGVSAIILITITTLIIAYTPLREFIPGYPDEHLKKQFYENILKADSLEKELKKKDLYFENLKKIISGTDIQDTAQIKNIDTVTLYQPVYSISKEDSLLRAEIEYEEQFNFTTSNIEQEKIDISQISFFPPLKGMISNEFCPEENHYGIDITSKKDAAIKSILDGTVILATWSLETGHTIAIQHKNNLISFYKHNSKLLKSVGERVKTGEAIAIIGTTGELSTGPHLHFELWYNGEPVNPADYIAF